MLITQRLAISCLTKLGLYRHIIKWAELDLNQQNPKTHDLQSWPLPITGYPPKARCTQDSNLQASKGQRFSRPLPHHPDMQRVNISVTNGSRTHIIRSTIWGTDLCTIATVIPVGLEPSISGLKGRRTSHLFDGTKFIKVPVERFELSSRSHGF